MKLMPKTACDISYAYDAKGRLASAVPVYHYYLQDHLENPGHSMIHGVNVRQISRITGVCFEVIHRAKRESAPCDYDVSIPLQGKNTNSIPIFSIEIEPYLHSKTFDAIRENNPNGCYK